METGVKDSAERYYMAETKQHLKLFGLRFRWILVERTEILISGFFIRKIVRRDNEEEEEQKHNEMTNEETNETRGKKGTWMVPPLTLTTADACLPLPVATSFSSSPSPLLSPSLSLPLEASASRNAKRENALFERNKKSLNS